MPLAGYSWCLSSSLPLSVGFSIHDEDMDVARSAPQGAHYHAHVFLLAHLTGNEGSSTSHMALRDKPTQAWSPTNNLYTPMYNTLVFYTMCVMPVGHLQLCAVAKLKYRLIDCTPPAIINNACASASLRANEALQKTANFGHHASVIFGGSRGY